MRRSGGVRWLTARPPMRISPDVGVSSPAIIRKSVVFPEPEGPRKTRNSPSRVSRFTLLTAPSCPSLKTFVRSRVSTTAIGGRPVWSFPPGKDTPVFVFGSLGGILGSFVAARHFGEHGGNDPRFEGLIDGGCGVTWIADVGGPIENVAEDFVFVRGIGAWIVGNFLLQVGNGSGEAGEIVELASDKRVVEGVNEIDEELLAAGLVFGEVPDEVAVHDVLGGDATYWTLQRRADHDLAVDGQMLAFGLAVGG